MQVVQQSPGALPSGAARHSRPPTPIAVMGFGGERDPEAPMGRARLQRQMQVSVCTNHLWGLPERPLGLSGWPPIKYINIYSDINKYSK